MIDPAGSDEAAYLTAWISRSALEHNLGLLRACLKPDTKMCAVVKADCYGHGWDTCLEVIARHVDWLAVATLDEAMELSGRECGLEILAFFSPAAVANETVLAELIRRQVNLTVTCDADLAAVSAAAARAGRDAKIHVKADSGMTRSGVWSPRAPDLIRRVRSEGGVQLVGLYSHFSSADETEKAPTHEQFGRFMEIVETIGGHDELTLHIDNSAGTIDLPEHQLDMVRTGIAVYGYQPSDEMLNPLPLRPILRLTGRLMAVKDVPAGAKAGYGRTYEFPQAARIGTTHRQGAR